MLKKKEKINLTKQQKLFAKQMFNYAISLCILNDNRSINELSELIRIQNERRAPK